MITRLPGLGGFLIAVHDGGSSMSFRRGEGVGKHSFVYLGTASTYCRHHFESRERTFDVLID